MKLSMRSMYWSMFDSPLGKYGYTLMFLDEAKGTMQGIMLMSGSLARTLGPLLVSWLFQVHGPLPVWGIELGTLGATLLLWLIFYRRLVPLKIRELKCGEYMKYPDGVKYRM
ncbi:hypothetical protein OSTOST_07688 [Ostertagia ostertagi]